MSERAPRWAASSATPAPWNGSSTVAAAAAAAETVAAWEPQCWTAAMGRRLLRRAARREEDRRKRARVYRCEEYATLPSMAEYQNSGRRRLESFEAAFRYLFEHSDTRLGSEQKRLVDVITIALLVKMFGDDLVPNLRFLRKKYLIDELNDTVAIFFPRRSGKTEGSAILIACVAVSQPNGNCIMYNLTATQAKEFLQSVIKHLKTFEPSEEFGWRLVRRDLRQFIVIETKKYGTINSVKSYACGRTDGKIGCFAPGRALSFSPPSPPPPPLT